MNCTVRSGSTGNPLTDAHTTAFETVAALYDGQDPRSFDTYHARSRMLERTHTLAHRAALVDALRPYLERMDAPPASLAALERLRDVRAVAVVTGQQAGLFTGPLYTLYKAMTVLGLARRLEADLGRPVVPVFWIASEDHDWDEVNHAWILDRAGELARIRLTLQPAEHQMVGHIPLPAETAQQALRDAWRALPDGIGKADTFALLEQAFISDGSLADWFARILLRLFGSRGLVVLDPCLPALRELVRPVWRTALARHEQVQSELDRAYDDVERAGFQPVVVRDRTHTTLFYVHHGRRYVLEAAGPQRLRVRGLGLERSVEEWIALAEAEPTAFSSNVLLRPVVQDHLLPTLAYVGGPAEIAYHALSRGVFRAHGRTLPPLVHRQRMVLYPPSVARLMAQHGLTIEALEQPVDLEARVVDEAGGRELAAEFAGYRKDAVARWQAWAEAHASLGPQIHAIARRHAECEAASLLRFERKARRLVAQREEARLRQVRRIQRWLWTDGHPQERRLSPLNAWVSCGLSWIEEAPHWGDYDGPCPVYHLML